MYATGYVANGYVDALPTSDLVGLLDTGASSVVIGHNGLMTLLTQMHSFGITMDSLRFRPANKLFHLDTYLSTTGRSGPELALAAEEPPAEEEEDRFDPAGINLHYEESPEDVFKPITNK